MFGYILLIRLCEYVQTVIGGNSPVVFLSSFGVEQLNTFYHFEGPTRIGRNVLMHCDKKQVGQELGYGCDWQLLF